ncbi:MAG TPA: hypothetical protein VEB22_05715 [Phycisphaerales bacterium]|nr:hypothetical protein [Phycisphaerales bacterium]
MSFTPSMSDGCLMLSEPRAALIRRLAGALAEASTASLTLQEPGSEPRPLAARTTDLPALLRPAPIGTRLKTPDGCTITLTDEGCTISNPGRALLEALGPTNR